MHLSSNSCTSCTSCTSFSRFSGLELGFMHYLHNLYYKVHVFCYAIAKLFNLFTTNLICVLFAYCKEINSELILRRRNWTWNKQVLRSFLWLLDRNVFHLIHIWALDFAAESQYENMHESKISLFQEIQISTSPYNPYIDMNKFFDISLIITFINMQKIEKNIREID